MAQACLRLVPSFLSRPRSTHVELKYRYKILRCYWSSKRNGDGPRRRREAPREASADGALNDREAVQATYDAYDVNIHVIGVLVSLSLAHAITGNAELRFFN